MVLPSTKLTLEQQRLNKGWFPPNAAPGVVDPDRRNRTRTHLDLTPFTVMNYAGHDHVLYVILSR